MTTKAKVASPVPSVVRPVIEALRKKLPAGLDPITGSGTKKNGKLDGSLSLKDDVLVVGFQERLDLDGDTFDASRGSMLFGLVSESPGSRNDLVAVMGKDVPAFGDRNDYVTVSITELRREGASYFLKADVTVDLKQLHAFNDYLEAGPSKDDETGNALVASYGWLMDLLRLVCRLDYSSTTVGERFAGMVDAFADEDEELVFADEEDPLEVEDSAEAAEAPAAEATAAEDGDGEEVPAPKPTTPAPAPRPAAKKKAAPAPVPEAQKIDPELEAQVLGIMAGLGNMDIKNESIGAGDELNALLAYQKAGGTLKLGDKAVTVNMLGKVKPVINLAGMSVKRGKTALDKAKERRKK